MLIMNQNYEPMSRPFVDLLQAVNDHLAGTYMAELLYMVIFT